MKRMLKVLIALAVIGVAAGAAWWGYGQVFGSGDVWYAQVDSERLSAAGENNNGFDYHYDLPAANAAGKTRDARLVTRAASCATGPTCSSRRLRCAEW